MSSLGKSPSLLVGHGLALGDQKSPVLVCRSDRVLGSFGGCFGDSLARWWCGGFGDFKRVSLPSYGAWFLCFEHAM